MGSTIKHTVGAGAFSPTLENIKIPPESAKNVNIEIGEGIDIPADKGKLMKVNEKSILQTSQGKEIEMANSNAFDKVIANNKKRKIKEESKEETVK